MPGVLAGMAAAAVIQGIASKRASDAQQDAAGQGMGFQQQQYADSQAQYDEIRNLLMPFIQQGEFGMEGRNDVLGELRNWGDTGLQRVKNNPLTQGILRSAEDSVLANASATGGLRGGNVQDALARTRTGILSALENQQYNRTAGLYDAYGNIVGGAQNAAGILGGLNSANSQRGAQYAQQMGGLAQQQGAAQAGGILGMGSALSSGLSAMGGFMGGGMGAPPAAPMGQQWQNFSPYGGMGMQNYNYIDNDSVQGLGYGGRGF